MTYVERLNVKNVTKKELCRKVEGLLSNVENVTNTLRIMFDFNESFFSLQYKVLNKGTGNGFWLKMHFQRKKRRNRGDHRRTQLKIQGRGVILVKIPEGSMVFLAKISRGGKLF
jgi:hypothetical protein